MHKEIVVVIS